MRGSRLRLTSVVLVLAIVGASQPLLGGVCSARSARFVAPVGGEIVRSFEAPLGPYASGHRGIDFGVEAGSVVSASGDGVVIFAGPVADDGLFITLSHDGEISTTYSFLSEVGVSVGQQVRRGETIGLSGDGHPGEGIASLHFGAKLVGQYIDPEILLFGNLDDVSDLISLAPFEDDPSQEGYFLGSDAGADDRTAVPLRSKRGFFIRYGEEIDAAASATKGVVSSMGRWFESKIKSFGQLVGRAIHRTGAAISAGAKATSEAISAVDRWLAKQWIKATNAIQRSADWTKALIRRSADAARLVIRRMVEEMVDVARWMAAKSWAAFRVLDGWVQRGWDLLAASGRQVLEWFSAGFKASMPGQFVTAAKEEVKCRKQGGAKAPRIPTSAELAKGLAPPPAPNDNIIVAVAGIGSHSSMNTKTNQVKGFASIYEVDFKTFGYSQDHIFHYSYKGLEDRGGEGPYRIHAAYSKDDSYQDINISAIKLGRQLEEIHKQFPDKKIDIVAHSQGGVVAQTYLATVYRPDSGGAQIDQVVTIASPHRGTEGAVLARRLSATARGREWTRRLDRLASRTSLFPPPGSMSVMQLAEGSELISEIDRAWQETSVRATSIGATSDFIVPPHRTRLSKSAQYTPDLPMSWAAVNGHSAVVSALNTKEILYNSLAGRRVRCTPLRNTFANLVTGRAISRMEQGLVGTVSVFLGSEW